MADRIDDCSTVASALGAAKRLGIDRLDAQLMLAQALGRPRSWLLAHGDAALPLEQAGPLARWLERRAAGEPLAYLFGEKEFHGLMLQVSPAVLVPRPDTETLVDWALELLPACRDTASARVVDLGTGSGAIALALKHKRSSADVTAIDASKPALEVARANAVTLNLDISLRHGDWWQGLPARHFHVAVSNPPYIAGDDGHLAALHHEPRMALTPEGDGLEAFRQIISDAPRHLVEGGWLLLEHGHDQARQVRDLLERHGFSSLSTRFDLAGQARCTGGRCL